MKVNHRRKNPSGTTKHIGIKKTMFSMSYDGFHANTLIGHDQAGSAGERHAVKGAKQFLRHESRRHGKRICIEMLNEESFD